VGEEQGTHITWQEDYDENDDNINNNNNNNHNNNNNNNHNNNHNNNINNNHNNNGKNTSHDWLSYNYTTACCSSDDNLEISHFWWRVDHRLYLCFQG
jgi:hypothetical protein